VQGCRNGRLTSATASAIRIAEVWVARDERGLLRQLGLAPVPDAAGA
jgi:hypothetical protein